MRQVPQQPEPRMDRKAECLRNLCPLVRLPEWELLEDYLKACRDEFQRKLCYTASTLEDLKKNQGLVKFCDELLDMKTVLQKPKSLTPQ